MIKLYFFSLLFLAASVSLSAQKHSILPQKKQDSILQKLMQPSFPPINKPFKSIPLDLEKLKLKDNFVLDGDFKSAMPVFKPDTTYYYPMRILTPNKAYEYKMRIIDQPVQNSQRDQS